MGDDGGFGGMDGAPNEGTLGGTMSDGFGENSATMGGETSSSQADANNDAAFGGVDSGGFGFGLTDSFMDSMSNPSFTGQNTNAPSFNTSMTDEDGPFGKFGKQALNMALNVALSKMGISPIAMGIGKTGLAAMSAPNQQAETDAVGKGFMGMMMGLTGLGPAVGMANMGLNAMSNAGMIGQPNTNADGSAAPAGTTGASSMGTNGMGGAEGILGGLASLYGYNRANGAANDQINSLSGMYGQDSPYAQMLRQQLSRKDAAGGRRSQYGPREVELQARLAGLAAGNAGQIGQLRQGQNQMRAQGLAQLMQFMNKSGATQGISNGLQGLFNQGSGQQFDQSYGPALDPYGAGSGWGQDTMSNMGMGGGQDWYGG